MQSFTWNTILILLIAGSLWPFGGFIMSIGDRKSWWTGLLLRIAAIAVFLLGGMLMSVMSLHGDGLFWRVHDFILVAFPGLPLDKSVIVTLSFTMLTDIGIALFGLAVTALALKLGEALEERIYRS